MTNDTIILYRQPGRLWRDGLRSMEDYVGVVLHREPFDPTARRSPDAGSDRTVLLGNSTREAAIAQLESQLGA